MWSAADTLAHTQLIVTFMSCWCVHCC